MLTETTGTAERTRALDMIEDKAKPGSTVGANKLYATADFVAGCRPPGLHPACGSERQRPPLCNRWAHHPSSRLCHQHDQAKANRTAVRLEEDDRGLAQDQVRRQHFVFIATIYNLVRIPKILGASG